jgi:hypothetical protein
LKAEAGDYHPDHKQEDSGSFFRPADSQDRYRDTDDGRVDGRVELLPPPNVGVCILELVDGGLMHLLEAGFVNLLSSGALGRSFLACLRCSSLI